MLRAALQTPTIVLPGKDQLFVDCGTCGGREFAAHVQVAGADARVTELVCTKCKRVYKVEYGLLRGKETRHAKPGRRPRGAAG